MQFLPTITDYVNAVNESTCFKTLNPIFLKNSDGNKIYCTGKNSVIFKVEIDEKCYSLKLYTSFNELKGEYFRELKEYVLNSQSNKNSGVNTLPNFEYFEQEIAVYLDGELHLYPLLLTEWIEGETLHRKIERFSALGLKNELSELTNRFISFSRKLLGFDFSHIDLKPDNIIVTDNNDFRLIDIDALYIPSYIPEYVTEQGTEWYRHPNRKEGRYEAHLHDYPIVIIVVTLLSLEKRQNLYEKYSNGENLIFSPYDISRGRDKAYVEVCEMFSSGIEKELIESLTSSSVKINNIDKLLGMLYYVRFGTLNLDSNNDDLTLFDDYVEVGNGVIAVKHAGLWNFVTKNGRILSDFSMTKINRFSEGKIVVLISEEWRVLDEKFNTLFVFDGGDATFYSQNRLAVKRNEKWGYLDEKGDIAIDFRFNFARKFNNDLIAEVKEGGLLKEIDVNGH